jgi:hypothetical protein
MDDDSQLSPLRQTEPENPPKEINPGIETKTINPNQETENMEVHAHELHKAPGHGWKHYLFEFFMLFLAVFCGFLAENWREHVVDQEREKQYVKSFYQDLTEDEKDQQRTINNLDHEVKNADSLFVLLNNMNTTQPANQVYMLLRGMTRSGSVLVRVNDRTIVQLRNAGGMRLIRNKNVSDSMVVYYKEIGYLQFLFDESVSIRRSLREKIEPLLNAADFAKIVDSTNAIINPTDVLHLRSADQNTINSCLLEVNNIRGLSIGTKQRIQALRERAGRIKKYIKEEYKLE